uniref:Uncharacterized protein n=1 Tax=Quercus lobata TaxID=97700 RepID=A0A7N2M8J4_QUELO
MVRAPFYDKNGLKKGAWSVEEDNKLRSYIQRFGHWNWRELPKFAASLPGRSDNDIKNHWHAHLKKRTKKPTTSKMKTLSNEAYQHDADIARKTETDSSVSSSPSYQIQESSQLPLETSSSEFSYLSFDNAPLSGINWTAEDSLATLETLEQSFSDFWTEPFILDNTYIQNNYPEPLAGGRFSASQSCYNEGIDSIYEAMQEVENYQRINEDPYLVN